MRAHDYAYTFHSSFPNDLRAMRHRIATKLSVVRDLWRGLSDTLAYAYDARGHLPGKRFPGGLCP